MANEFSRCHYISFAIHCGAITRYYSFFKPRHIGRVPPLPVDVHETSNRKISVEVNKPLS